MEVAAEVAVAARHLHRRLVLRHLSHPILLGHARLDEERLALEGDPVERERLHHRLEVVELDVAHPLRLARALVADQPDVAHAPRLREELEDLEVVGVRVDPLHQHRQVVADRLLALALHRVGRRRHLAVPPVVAPPVVAAVVPPVVAAVAPAVVASVAPAVVVIAVRAAVSPAVVVLAVRAAVAVAVVLPALLGTTAAAAVAVGRLARRRRRRRRRAGRRFSASRAASRAASASMRSCGDLRAGGIGGATRRRGCAAPPVGEKRQRSSFAQPGAGSVRYGTSGAGRARFVRIIIVGICGGEWVLCSVAQ